MNKTSCNQISFSDAHSSILASTFILKKEMNIVIKERDHLKKLNIEDNSKFFKFGRLEGVPFSSVKIPSF